jgi:hypothetical protein
VHVQLPRHTQHHVSIAQLHHQQLQTRSYNTDSDCSDSDSDSNDKSNATNAPLTTRNHHEASTMIRWIIMFQNRILNWLPSPNT